MQVAYLDTSCLLAVVFDEPDAPVIVKRLTGFDRLVSSNLLEAELRSALAREGVDGDVRSLLSWVDWVHPNRQLTPEFNRILPFGYVKGADLWHLACALFLAPDPHLLTFLTLDKRQEQVATRLGFLL
jgi:hypothetical protein